MLSSLGETIWHFLRKLNMYFIHDPGNPHNSISPREMKVSAHKETLTSMIYGSFIHHA